MRGIILAGGAGTRLYPMTQIVCKQLQPIYDKPMIFYPLSMLMLADIREILIISTPKDTPVFEQLLGDGSSLGLRLSYVVQDRPSGLPDAFILGRDFIGKDDVTLILGDNLFYGDSHFLREAVVRQKERLDSFRGRIFAYQVDNPKRYGVVEFDKQTGKVLSLEEKPDDPKSSYAIPGLYIFDGTVAERAANIRPSPRGETEIVELMKSYDRDGTLGVQTIGRGVTWLDTGTPESLLEASNLIATIEKRQGLKVACLHEIAIRRHFISPQKLVNEIELLPPSQYREYLQRVHAEIEEERAGGSL